MKRRPHGPKTGARTLRAEEPAKRKTSSVKRPKADRPSGHLERMLSLIGAHPGIRPSELNRLLKVEQSDGLRNTLIRRGLIRKEKDGSAMRYYLV